MSNNRDLLKEAIADAKAVKETAIANAKAALEEAFTPHLKSMLSAKLEEMDDKMEEDDVKSEAKYGNYEEDDMKSEAKYGNYEEDDMKSEMKYGKYEEDDMKSEEVAEAEEIDEINLDELLAELDEEMEDKKDRKVKKEEMEDKPSMKKKKMEESEDISEAEEIEESEEVNESEEIEESEEVAEQEEMEGEMEEEEIDLEDMSEDDLKSFIEDVIKDMVEAGELEAGEEMEMDGDESEMDMDIEMEDSEEEIMEMDEVSWNEKNNPSRGVTTKALDPKKVGQSTSDYAVNINEQKELVNEVDPLTVAAGVAAVFGGSAAAVELMDKAKAGKFGDVGKKIAKHFEEMGAAAGAVKRMEEDEVSEEMKDPKMKKKDLKESEIDMTQALKEIEELKNDLQEVNLLNAKLLYTNKIFKSKNLSEDKKVKVLKAFDKATTVKEAKVIFETLNEGLSSKITKTSISEVKGSASKATGVAPKAKQPIVENSAFARMQKLAGIIKN